jgi:hypothetical protein
MIFMIIMSIKLVKSFAISFYLKPKAQSVVETRYNAFSPGIHVVAGQLPCSVAWGHGHVDAILVLNTGGVDINASGLADPPISQAFERGHLEAVRLLVQQNGRLQINQDAMTACKTIMLAVPVIRRIF